MAMSKPFKTGHGSMHQPKTVFCASVHSGCDGVPSIEKKTVGKMGLKGVTGLNLGNSEGGGRQNQGVCGRASDIYSSKQFPCRRGHCMPKVYAAFIIVLQPSIRV